MEGTGSNYYSLMCIYIDSYGIYDNLGYEEKKKKMQEK